MHRIHTIFYIHVIVSQVLTGREYVYACTKSRGQFATCALKGASSASYRGHNKLFFLWTLIQRYDPKLTFLRLVVRPGHRASSATVFLSLIRHFAKPLLMSVTIMLTHTHIPHIIIQTATWCYLHR